jgi:hypothetical protein
MTVCLRYHRRGRRCISGSPSRCPNLCAGLQANGLIVKLALSMEHDMQSKSIKGGGGQLHHALRLPGLSQLQADNKHLLKQTLDTEAPTGTAQDRQPT